MAVRPLSPDLEEIARQELNEDPARIEGDLKHLREWLSKQPHLTARTDAQWLLTFLRGCKFSLERTKFKLDMFYTLRSAMSDFFVNRDPTAPAIQEFLKLGMLVPLPEPDDKGRRVMIFRGGLNDPDKTSIIDMFKLNMMFMDTVLDGDDRAVICGTVSIMDNSHLTLAHMKNMSFSLMKRATVLWQDGYPLRPKALHYVYMNPAFTTIFNTFKSFMKEKFRNRIFLHSNMDTVYKEVPKRILPTEYGGDAGPIDKIINDFNKQIVARKSWFKDDEKFGVDEKKRPGKPKTQEDLFGLEGSFRQLVVD